MRPHRHFPVANAAQAASRATALPLLTSRLRLLVIAKPVGVTEHIHGGVDSDACDKASDAGLFKYHIHLHRPKTAVFGARRPRNVPINKIKIKIKESHRDGATHL